MVIYDLLCNAHHQFEAWFKSSDDFQKQKDADLLSCPVCETKDVRKIPSTTYVNTKTITASVNEKAEYFPAQQGEMNKLMREIKTHIENNSVDVGNRFVEEAKKMHYGETQDKKNIRGLASSKEILELHEEGINTFQLPSTWVDKRKLN